ncbi:bifunctional adenosylcobinamide kinase/adenosylcobinamide-phosphate guanylyltransferase [Desulfobacter hydrogenophilus]|uniref:Adenosylcobinamide kinase n=1 Tax=Desulfobacter hydrogenophilus TaxID=2291 RepID=A0A328FIH9_9BACT|nr:bifunctional adenosylcobinamide kinase/adenosylcobinamide-phosphate guanylyltransferase [Desulfobacter hydrogenophilus]NDY72709.1 bifunctional adenosylcobinamide kinase/adenosylcobinamide-phosphate guanylyltransferase [Desulfobacter hydrogenophilus]QBH12546.1 bifunctional adenosylcobinamide kinase/adenosylcobinamide-phosphate guanylyltransferase [Desulfobacter hydrogenophilus]RAM03282.1 bifunctional adenosylcobinamide kinase/adenosylcobinamide-phosphate guanylyltransferase [Desulfobacter hydr
MTDITRILVLGGCRSGKSRFAKQTADNMAMDKKIYLATCVPTDREMKTRVKRHQDDRGPDWATIEEPIRIHETIDRACTQAKVILVDCLTLWISNLLFQGKDEAGIMSAVDLLEDALNRATCPVVLVSNEVGYGIVPENSLARQFRDMAGLVNQRVARAVDKVIVSMAGIPVQIKPESGNGQGLGKEI